MFIFTHFFILALSSKAILLVDKLPNKWAIIIGKCLNIWVNIKILSLIILLILDVPNPLICSHSLILPLLYALTSRGNFVWIKPYTRNIFFITSTNSAWGWFAKSCGMHERTLLIEIESNYSKKFSLNHLVKLICSRFM